MNIFTYEIKVPKERIAVIIGKEGCIKKELEEATKTTLRVDSQEGDVFITGSDALGLYTAREILKAIGRGFNPEIAQLLLKADYAFEVISLVDYGARTKEGLQRIKGRVIGSAGKARKLIEELTQTYISVFGKTVSIIGTTEDVALARQAVESILKGATHSSVYQWLERKRKQIKRSQMRNW